MKFSVVTVCYNSEKTIERTLQSFFSQDYPHKELIIVDGGSTDSTLGILERYRPQISVFISEPDKGIYDAMNKGWQRATGDFVHFLNSDDWYVSSQVLTQVASLAKDPRTIYHGRLRYHHEDGHQTLMGRPLTPKDLQFELKGIHQPASFFPRKLFDLWGGFDISYRISSDYELIRRFMQKASSQFVDLDVVCMSDAGASAKQIATGLKENYQIAVRYGESPWAVKKRNLWVGFWLKVRYSWPWAYRLLKTLKDIK